MSERINSMLEKSLFNLNKYGLKPQINDLEELIKLGFIESSPNDGWLISEKGREYIKNHISTI